jgi:hypothetical protein
MAMMSPRETQQDGQQGAGQQPAQRCPLLRIDPDGTEVFKCGDHVLYNYPDGSIAMMSLRETQQDGQQQDGGQQQAPSRQEGYGCAARE